jgi:hypothetical protein
MAKKNREYETFVNLAERLISVPHSEVKAKLDAEKKAKAQKKARKTSVKLP